MCQGAYYMLDRPLPTRIVLLAPPHPTQGDVQAKARGSNVANCWNWASAPHCLIVGGFWFRYQSVRPDLPDAVFPLLLCVVARETDA
jgi:hypothetical protein